MSHLARQVIIFLCIASFLAVPVRFASNGLAVIFYTSFDSVEKPAGSCPMCHAGERGQCHCPCCQGGSCSCSVSSGEDDDSQLVLVLESAVPPDQSENLPDLPSAALTQISGQNVAGIASPVPTPPPRT